MPSFPSVRSTPTADLYTTTVEGEGNARVSYVRGGIQESGWAVLVDLSDTAQWPHDETGQAIISVVNAVVDRSSSTVGLMQLAVATRIGATNGDASVLFSMRFEQGLGENIIRDLNVAPSQLRTLVVGGETPWLLTNVMVLNDTGLQNDVALDSPLGAATVIPAPGDILVRYVHTSGGIWTGGMGLMYHGASVSA